MKIEVVSWKENIMKADVTTEACKENFDTRIEELEVLKAQLKEAESVFEEVNRELLRLLTEEVVFHYALCQLSSL